MEETASLYRHFYHSAVLFLAIAVSLQLSCAQNASEQTAKFVRTGVEKKKAEVSDSERAIGKVAESLPSVQLSASLDHWLAVEDFDEEKQYDLANPGESELDKPKTYNVYASNENIEPLVLNHECNEPKRKTRSYHWQVTLYKESAKIASSFIACDVQTSRLYCTKQDKCGQP
jgi:hypothetical protein